MLTTTVVADSETLPEYELLTAAAALLARLAGRLGEPAHLSALDGAHVVTLLSAPAGSVSALVSAACTSAGRALLFDTDRRGLERLFAGSELPPQGRGAPRDVAELHRRIAASRIHGYALVDREFERDRVGIAAPVRDRNGRIVAAVNVSSPKFRYGTQLEAIGAPHVMQTADELSQLLAGAPEREGEPNG